MSAGRERAFWWLTTEIQILVNHYGASLNLSFQGGKEGCMCKVVTVTQNYTFCFIVV